jgi:hypothetical protein
MAAISLTDAPVAVAEGASIRLRRRGVVTRTWGTTERRQLALSSAELRHGAARAKGLRAPAEVVGRTVCLGKTRGVPAGPVLRFSIVKACAERTAQALTA